MFLTALGGSDGASVAHDHKSNKKASDKTHVNLPAIDF